MDDTILTAMQLDIREIKTLLIERKEILEKHTVDIDKAFKAIRSVNESVLTQAMTIKKLEEFLQVSQESHKQIDERLANLEKFYHRMSWIGAAGMAVLGAAAVKFFVG
jgi:hypothetical protein